MVRTQIQLGEEQAERLRRLAAERSVSIAALIRQAVSEMLRETEAESRRKRVLSLAGAFASGKSDISVEHDRYLEEAYLE